MPIFRRDSEPLPSGAPPRPPVRRAEPTTATAQGTHIAAGSRVGGEIGGSAPVRVDGELEGRIHVEEKVVIGAGGRIQGEIQARTVEVGGKVEGDVRAAERIEILASGSVLGDISAPRVTIAEGAFFKGQVEMGGKAQQREKAAKPMPSGSGQEAPKTGEAKASLADSPPSSERPVTSGRRPALEPSASGEDA